MMMRVMQISVMVLLLGISDTSVQSSEQVDQQVTLLNTIANLTELLAKERQQAAVNSNTVRFQAEITNVDVLSAFRCPTCPSCPKPESGCMFPFRHESIVYNSCTTVELYKAEKGTPWCSTYTNSEGTHQRNKWKYCQDSEPCQYPFITNGKTYHNCSLSWCSTKTDENNNHIQNYWKLCELDER